MITRSRAKDEQGQKPLIISTFCRSTAEKDAAVTSPCHGTVPSSSSSTYTPPSPQSVCTGILEPGQFDLSRPPTPRKSLSQASSDSTDMEWVDVQGIHIVDPETAALSARVSAEQEELTTDIMRVIKSHTHHLVRETEIQERTIQHLRDQLERSRQDCTMQRNLHKRKLLELFSRHEQVWDRTSAFRQSLDEECTKFEEG